MEMLQTREKEIFETLKKIKSLDFVVIGGYAVNSYSTLPRFSVDCDIVAKNKVEANRIIKELTTFGYKKTNITEDIAYKGNFLRYGKELVNHFKVSIDILIETIIDRQTNSTFSADWIFENSKLTKLIGKTIREELKLKIISPDGLVVMKLTSGRSTDIRDVFMIADKIKDIDWVKNEINKRCNYSERINNILSIIISKNFKDNLQGIYGYIDEKVFEKQKKAVIKLENPKS